MRAVAWILLLTYAALYADRPQRPPATHVERSLNGEYQVESNLEAKKTTVYRSQKEHAALWSIPGWYRVVAVSNDGEHVVVGHDSSNLLAPGFTSEEVMLTFYERGRLIRKVKLRELLPDLGALRKTASHWVWGEYLGFDRENRYRVKLVTGAIVSFDPATGKRY